MRASNTLLKKLSPSRTTFSKIKNSEFLTFEFIARFHRYAKRVSYRKIYKLHRTLECIFIDVYAYKLFFYMAGKQRC